MVDKSILCDLHYNQKLSSIKIAKLYKVNSRTVRRWFEKYDIKSIGNTFQKGSLNPKNRIKSEKEIQRLKIINIGREAHNKGSGDKKNTCANCSKEYVSKPYRNAKYCSQDCRSKIKGESHWNFTGAESRGEQTKRNWSIYKQFKKEVHIRDNGKCRNCGNKGDIVHHIESWANNKNLRFSVKNGVTLCYNCHRDVHNVCGQKKYSFGIFVDTYPHLCNTCSACDVVNKMPRFYGALINHTN